MSTKPMGRKLCMIFGNGLTIDLLHHINLQDKIDVMNLFRYGAEVPWPATGEPGFLSFKHCPNLWNLGARPHMKTEDSLLLIEDIITCANAFASKEPNKRNTSKSAAKAPNEIYLNAFKELSVYLKYLFVYYDSIVQPELIKKAADWPWLLYLKGVYDGSYYNKIDAITFNYDPWLERLLMQLTIPFDNAPFTNPLTNKLSIIKPHGSISFCHKEVLERESFAIIEYRTIE